MKVTREYVELKFEEFNSKIFGGRLPVIPIRLSDASSFLGMCVSQVRRLPEGRKEHHSFELRINTRIDLPEDVVEDTIIHEMIHYFIHYNGLVDSSPHGNIFKAMMQSINSNFGRHITISHKSTPEQRDAFVSTKPAWHVIAVIHFCNGKTGIKVLPRVIPKIVDFYNTCLSVSEVRNVDLYLHNNPYFNRYPTSTALRSHDIDPSILKENLVNSHPLDVVGNKVLERTRRK